jgi:hypothetical protein
MLLKISAAPKGKGFNGRVFPKGKALSDKSKRVKRKILKPNVSAKQKY